MVIDGDSMSQKTRLILLNALPLNAIQSECSTILCRKIQLSEVVELIMNYDVENYIRHESTVKLLAKLSGKDLKPSSELYKHEDRDILVIITLKRPIRGQEVEVTEEDLEAYLCIIVSSDVRINILCKLLVETLKIQRLLP